jgi:hypothetical protein
MPTKSTQISEETRFAVQRPNKLPIQLVETEEEFAFIDRPTGMARWGASGFLMFWLFFWTIGCVFLAFRVNAERTVSSLLFAVPFWSAWFFVAALLVYLMFRKDSFALTPGGVYFIREALVPLQQRFVPLTEIQSFEPALQHTSDEAPPQHVVEMRTLGRPLQFGVGLNKDGCDWLSFELNRRLAQLRTDSGLPIAPVEAPEQPRRTGAAAQQGDAEVLRLMDSPATPPLDSDWRRLEDFQSVAFQQRGKFSLTGMGVALFLCAFWNGIVSVFLYQLIVEKQPGGMEWWFLFLFLIPFEAVGLLFFAILGMTIVEPLRRTTWRFGADAVRCTVRWLGLGPQWRYPHDKIDRIDLQRAAKIQAKAWKAGQRRITEAPMSSPFELMLSTSGQEVCRFSGLTEGEARWIADTLLRERPEWFQSR